MKKNKIFRRLLYITILTALSIGIYVFLTWFISGPRNPERLANIPINAVWHGSSDGGYWFELVERYTSEKFRIRIYNDYDGSLLLDADFIPFNENCQGFLKKEDLLENIIFYNNTHIQTKTTQCTYKPVFPAYGGEEWEVIKEKKEFSQR
jgi:hypothetical protein